jgi:hypothetical protein
MAANFDTQLQRAFIFIKTFTFHFSLSLARFNALSIIEIIIKPKPRSLPPLNRDSDLEIAAAEKRCLRPI